MGEFVILDGSELLRRRQIVVHPPSHDWQPAQPAQPVEALDKQRLTARL